MNDMTESASVDSAVPAVKSQPVYAPLCADLTGRHHLLVAETAGLDAALRVIDGVTLGEVPIEVFWLGAAPERLQCRVAVHTFDSIAMLTSALASRLSAIGMGLRVYLAGREAFLWQVNMPAIAVGLREDQVQREACGSKARRVFCVHCRHVLGEVTTNPIVCPSCGVVLEVRDHFSRALAAYVGVVANAEDPSDVPEPREQFV